MSEALSALSALVRVIHELHSREAWHEWKTDNEHVLSETFQYHRRDGMPPVTQLVTPDFHPELPLVLFNYTPAAGVSLHHYQNGWTPALKLCRGIIFDRDGILIGYPFPKFFNFGEYDGEMLPEPCEVTEKLDGHLIIAARHAGRVVLTTRGNFDSPTARLANEVAGDLVERWLDLDLSDVTACLELIAPETHVGVNYGERRALVLIALYDNATGLDLAHRELCKAADALGVEVVPLVEMTRQEMVAVPDTVESGLEGYVARWPNGYRVKLKYKAYVERVKEERSMRRADPRPKARDVTLQNGAPWLRG